jgi:hypothetical protein
LACIAQEVCESMGFGSEFANAVWTWQASGMKKNTAGSWEGHRLFDA